MDDAADILNRIRDVVGSEPKTVPLHAPEFNGNEWSFVKECIDTGWVSSVGSFVDDFERKVAAAAGTRNAVAVVNGTAALEIALRLVGVSPGDEVIVPALTFVATANAVTHIGAVPHFAEATATTLCLDPIALDAHLDQIAEHGPLGLVNRQTGRRIAAIVPMHALGYPVNMERLTELADRRGVAVVEDAAEALGSRFQGRPCGGLGRLGAFSFNGNKIITTGGGGAVTTNDDDLAKRVKHLTTTAKVPHPWAFDHDAPGYNYRLPNLNAALGCAQFEALPARLAEKRALAARYADAFADCKTAEMVHKAEDAGSNFWLNAIRLNEPDRRDHVLSQLNEAGIQARPLWRLMHRLPFHISCPRADLTVAEDLEARVICLPSSAQLGRSA
ncbi:MAG: LegC family aminotransferase [Pseudomonadota bacterium]